MTAPARAPGRLTDPELVRAGLDAVVPDGQVFEVRALYASAAGGRFPQTWSGYFDDKAEAVRSVGKLHAARGVYVTLNPVEPALLARARNRLRPVGKGEPTTSDTDVVVRRFLPIDADPVRPSGISSTDAEHEAALERCRQIADALTAEGWPRPIVADSGNGGGLLYPIDVPASDKGLVASVLSGLSQRFSDDAVRIDTSVHNPARIWKAYGTRACKGDDTPDRPHRLSRVLDVPSVLAAVTAEQLLAAAVVPDPPAPPAGRQNGRATDHGGPTRNGPAFDLADFVVRRGLDVTGPEPWSHRGGTGKRYVFRVCPWNADHTDGSAWVAQLASGAVAAGCQHNGCQGKGWPQLRAMFDPPRPAAPANRPTRMRAKPSVAARATPEPDGGVEAYDDERTVERRNRKLFGGLPPTPLAAAGEPPHMPAGLIAGTMGTFAEAVAAETETPLGLTVCNLLAALATVCQKRFVVRVEGDYVEPLSIWTAAAMTPGNRKSAAFQRVAGPLFRWEEEQAAALADEIEGAKSDLKTATARIEALRAKAAKAERAAYQFIVEEIKQLEAELPVVPFAPRLVADDVTVEHVATMMSLNGERIGILSDEGGVLDNVAGRYSNGMANVDVFNRGHSDSPVRVDRGSRPSIVLHHPAVTFGLTPQPVVLEAIAKNEKMRRSGFVDRFLYLLPASRLGYRNLEQNPVPADVLEAYRRDLSFLADVEPATDEDGAPTPHVLRLTKAAELGLDCSGTLGGAYLVPFKGEATLIIGYRGMIDLARRSGQVASIEARAVYTGDEFDVVYGTEPRIVHRPALDRGAGVFRLVYAVAHLSGGGTQFEILTGAEIEAVRRRSATGKSEKSPWSTDYEAMAKKSAIRRLFKTLPVSIDVRQAFADDEDREFRGDRGPAVPPADVNAMLGSRPAAPDGGDDAGDVTDPPDDDLGPDTGDGDPDVVDAEETGAADAG